MDKRVLALTPAAASLVWASLGLGAEPGPAADAQATSTATADAAVLPAESDPATTGRPPGVGGPDPDEKSFWEILGEDDPNPATYEIGFISMGINQAWGIANWRGGGFYFGAGGGVGTQLYRIAKMGDRDLAFDGTLEAVYGNVFFRIAPVEYVDLDLGGRLALGANTFDVPDPPRGGFVRGAYADLRVGSQKIKLGPRFEYDSVVYSDFTESGWKLTPLMLRVYND